ncbi:MAG: hypothetical protein ABSB01_21925 [Streptosporangiaceae bacterium]|jgi:hypothetical protein
MALDFDTVWRAALPADVVIPPGKPAMDLRWTFHIPAVDMDEGADYLADDSFEFAVVMASAYSRGCGPAWLSCGSGPANYELERGGSAGVRSCLRRRSGQMRIRR